MLVVSTKPSRKRRLRPEKTVEMTRSFEELHGPKYRAVAPVSHADFCPRRHRAFNCFMCSDAPRASTAARAYASRSFRT